MVVNAGFEPELGRKPHTCEAKHFNVAYPNNLELYAEAWALVSKLAVEDHLKTSRDITIIANNYLIEHCTKRRVGLFILSKNGLFVYLFILQHCVADFVAE